MSRICQICGKEQLKGNTLSHGIGHRVSRRTIRQQQPNLRIKRIEIGGQKIKVRMCASCLKRIKFDARKAAEVEATNETDKS